MKKPLHFLLGWLMGQFLTGCVVYMPMQCAAPQITDKKQAEITGSSYLNGRVEVAGTYSPVRHLLVRVAYSNLRDNPQVGAPDTTYYRGHQYDLALGTYWQLGAQGLVGVVGGYGQARGEAGYYRTGPLLSLTPPVRHDFDARYDKLFGEAYGVLQASNAISVGAAYRVTQVNFTFLTDGGLPVDLRHMTRSEPMLFFRVRIGRGLAETRPVQAQAAWGSSYMFGYNANARNATQDAAYELKQGRSYITLGISIFPHCLFQQAHLPSGSR